MRPAWRIVERRWAITIAVRPASRRRRPCSMRALGVQVDVRGRLVEHEDARVGDQRAGERDQLALAGRELRAALADFGVVAVRQLGDELLGADRGGGRADLLGGRRRGARRRCSRATVPENRNASCGHDPHLRAQRAARDVAQVVAVDEHAPGGRVVEARDELGHRRLARAGGADERDRLARAGCAGRRARARAPAVGAVAVGRRRLAPRAARRRRRRPRSRPRRGCARARSRPARSVEVGLHVEQLEDLLQRRHARLVGGVELGELLDRFEQVRQRGDERDDRADRDVAFDRLQPP